MTTQRNVNNIDSGTLSAWLKDSQVLLIDVRPPDMFAGERIAGAASIPLAILEKGVLPDLGDRKLVFHCQRGIASERAGRKILEQGFPGEVHHLEGGILAWKSAGFPVHGGSGETLPTGTTAAITIQRQAQIVAGSLVLLGIVLGATLSPWFLALSGLVGAGLVLTGVTGCCGMAALLVRLPFNRDTPN